MYRILLVDDDLTFSLMLRTWLTKKGFEVETASSAASAAKMLAESFATPRRAYRLVLSDLRLPDRDGLSLLTQVRTADAALPFILMTSYAEVQNAVAAMKLGATDYIAKPVQPDLLLEKINEALAGSAAKGATAVAEGFVPAPEAAQAPAAQAPSPEASVVRADGRDYLEGTSPAARRLYELASLVAPTPMSVLITGASGTGKEYVARRIHRQSKRAGGPFIAIDCGALTKELAASELFGHTKGAFTGATADKRGAFELAAGGTLFLDEVGNLDYDVQVQLLRALQERRVRPVGAASETEVDIRLVCATNENLPAAIAAGRFREDVYHRINEFSLEMPLLRERGADILSFARFFLNRANAELDRHISGFSPEAESLLLQYPWPGNLRELRNVVTRATLLARTERINAADISLPAAASVAAVPGAAAAAAVAPLRNEQLELERIRQALAAAGGNKSLAAKLLGIDRKTLYNKLKAADS